MSENSQFKNKIPSMVTFMRILLALVLFYLVINDLRLGAISLFTIACLSDVLDGYMARKLGATSSFGAYLDVVADFILVMAAFLAFSVKEIYPLWIPFIIILMFFQFMLTSRTKIPLYDPVGRYYGPFLFSVIFITLIVTDNQIYIILTVLIVLFTLISLLGRLYFLFTRHIKKVDS
jgi:phosphatidylglycerophosphate synthase